MRRPERRVGRIRRGLGWILLTGIAAGYLGLLFVTVYRPDPSDGMGGVETALTWLSLMGTTFLPHAGMGLLAVLAFAVIVRARRAAVAGVPLLAISLGPWAWTFAPPAQEPSPGARETLLVLSANLLASTRSEEALLAQIAAHRPDVILVQEVREASADRLRAALGGEYRVVAAPRDDNFGQAVLSRLPFTREPVVETPGASAPLPQMMAFVEFGGREVCVWDIHLMSPIDLSRTAEQAAMAHEMGARLDELAGAGTPAIVGGDFNGPWGAQPLDALRERGFREAHRAAGVGPGATWPRITMLRHAPGIRLDHIAFSGELECVGAWTGADTGSDHKPVFARLAWKR